MSALHRPTSLGPKNRYYQSFFSMAINTITTSLSYLMVFATIFALLPASAAVAQPSSSKETNGTQLSIESPASVGSSDVPFDESQTDDAAIEALGPMAVRELQNFVSAFSRIRKAYVEEIDDKTLLEKAIKGMLAELDPHSSFLDPQSFGDLQVSANGEFGGLGLEVGMENGFIKVIAPIDDTPAQKAGIESGDLIIQIDNKPVKGISLNEAVKMMRGPKGSSIELSIVRQGLTQPLKLTIMRDNIAVVSVRSKRLEEHYLYLRIAQFQANTGFDLIKAMQKAESISEVKGVILDMRNNPGGVLQAAVDVVDAFMDEGLVVYTEGRIPESKTRFEASKGNYTNTAPLVVLINGGSASASEIVAGALQDHKRAIILGSTSFGKGSVQTVLQFSETHGMKLTTARYYTPLGRTIQAKGIEPDIVVERAKLTVVDPGLKISEADLHKHLKNQSQSSAGKNTSSGKSKVSSQDDTFDDNQLHEALTLLKGINILNGNTKN